ncbi:NF-X1-type zinc finger protein NFXL1 [Tanacetum coccineum]
MFAAMMRDESIVDDKDTTAFVSLLFCNYHSLLNRASHLHSFIKGNDELVGREEQRGGGWVITNSARLASYPIDIARRTMMMTSGKAVKYKSSMDALSQIIKNEGAKSLFKGVGANILRAIVDKLQSIIFGNKYGSLKVIGPDCMKHKPAYVQKTLLLRFDIGILQISPPPTTSIQVVDMSRERIGNGNDRRQARNYRRQEWIPRGSTPSISPPPLDTTNININTPFARHRCVVQCHPGPCPPCKAFAPPRICPCGKKTITTRCLDQKSLLTCAQRCGKPLKCLRHCCSKTCHVGPCDSCDVQIDASCFCKKKIEVVCGDMAVKGHANVENDGIFSCNSSCGKPLGSVECFTHHHHDWMKQHIVPNVITLWAKIRIVWEPTLQLGFIALLKARDDFSQPEHVLWSSSIPPPLPCGTPPPSCQYPCSVPQPCGHPSSHSCHFGDCPPCSVPIPKECIGGHVVLRNIPCGSKDIRCNKLCGKMRQCGMHTCLRTCHPSPCDSSSSSSSGSTFGVKASCGQTCGAPRRDCKHTCTSLCHPHNTCPDVRCEFPVTITCSCGRITATVPCDAGGSNNSGYNVDTVLEASAVQKLPVPLQPVEVNGKKIPLGQRKLTCDDECSKVERKKVLADAFGVDTNLEALHFGESSAVSDMLGDLFRRDPKWVLSVEEKCKMLVHVFCPMLKEKRDAVRLIADRWKLSVHAAGWEPKWFIVVHVTPKSKAPSQILGAKGLNPSNLIHLSSFDPLVDVDPRLVVAWFDLPGDADVSALVLRFGGECELVWLNDKNALAVFSNPALAATALRRLDHGSVYHGVAVLSTNGTSSTGKAVVQQDHSDSWSVAQEWVNPETSPWKVKEGPLITTSSANRWSILESEVGSSQESGKVLASNVLFENEPSSSSTSSSNAAAALKQDDVVVED